jgi:glyoxylase-like metal-dependent hydrolase (beta-lactamase superfamily II)
MLEIASFTLGPAQTNAYLVADSETREAAVIDPSWDGHIILGEAQKRGWRIGHLWYTHAHFDHIGGAAAIADASGGPLPLVALHPNDHVLWRAGGGGALFGFDIDPGPEPTIDLLHGMKLRLGSVEFEVRFTPGHTPGHCILYVANIRAPEEHQDYSERSEPTGERSRSAPRLQAHLHLRLPDTVPSGIGEVQVSQPTLSLPLSAEPGICFCGDLIFAGSVGRTDFPGGDWNALVKSIREQVFTLPDDTRLLSGHGPETTVGEEKRSNPFVGASASVGA